MEPKPKYREITDDRILAEIPDSSLSVEDRLDLKTATIYIEKLDQPFKAILQWSFGVDDNPELSDLQISKILEISPYFIKKFRTKGIKQLRRLMGL